MCCGQPRNNEVPMVTTEIDEGVAILTLNRLEALNALSRAMMQSLDRALDQIVADERVRAVVVTGGLELVLCCYVFIAAVSARLGDGHANSSIIPAGGSTARLPRKVPANVAMHLLLSAELHAARDFAAWGLVNKVVPYADLRVEAASLARGYARHSRRVLAAIKRLTQGAAAPVAKLARSQLEAFADYVNHPDLSDGLMRFAARR